jgi:hypothetical protein
MEGNGNVEDGGKKVAFEEGTKGNEENSAKTTGNSRSVNESVAKCAKFRWVIRVECNIRKGEVFNPRKALLWLFEEMWKVDRGAIMSCANENGKDKLVRTASEYPRGHEAWMGFFPYVARDLMSGGMTVCTSFKIESVLAMESFKKPDMLEKLKARNMFLEKHNFQSFDLQAIGFFVGKCPRTTLCWMMT